jgi:hypothetical protein
MDAAQRARLGHLWMLRQDLLGYVLLGDPAARLPLTPPAAQRRATPSDFFPFAVAPPTARPAAPAAPTAPTVDPLEAAILQLLAGAPVSDAAVQQAGVDRAELERLAGLYRAAGRAAIAGARPGR